MTNDELRALADCLDDQNAMQRTARRKAADYLRACAEAQPVARLLHWHGPKPDPRTVIVARTFDEYSVQEADDPKSYWKNGEPLYTHPAPAAPEIKERGPWTDRHTSVQAWIESDDFTHDVRLYVNGDFESNDQRIAYAQEIARRLNAAPAAPAGWKWVPVEPTPEMLSAVGMMDGYDWHAPGCSPDADHANWYSAMIAAAPAASQAEPKRDWSTIDAAIREYLDNYELIGEDDSGADACYTPTERELYLIYDAINGLLADESFVAAISAPQAEQPIDLDAVAMQQMRQAAAESTWMPAEYSGSDWISDVCRWLRDGPPQAEPKREPLGDWRIAEEVKNRQIYGDGADAFYEGVRWAEHSHGIGGSDAE